VDDGSTDATPNILRDYATKHDGSDRDPHRRGKRSWDRASLMLFYSGYDVIDPDAYDFLCKLDLDLRLPPRYFEILFSAWWTSPIATCSGKPTSKKMES